jgi:hypothetical protein
VSGVNCETMGLGVLGLGGWICFISLFSFVMSGWASIGIFIEVLVFWVVVFFGNTPFHMLRSTVLGNWGSAILRYSTLSFELRCLFKSISCARREFQAQLPVLNRNFLSQP